MEQGILLELQYKISSDIQTGTLWIFKKRIFCKKRDQLQLFVFLD
jgi:hypothetical protein